MEEKWIEGYLNDRKQFVKISSSPLGISCGVAQCSVLGPRLVIIHNMMMCVLFADDTNILYSDANIKSLNNVINSELDLW